MTKSKNVRNVILKVLTYVRTHPEELLVPNIWQINFVIWSWTHFLTFCAQKTRKIRFWGRGVLRDEFLHMWELSGWQSEHFLILSYGPKLISWPFVLKKNRKIKFWGRGVLRDEFLHMWELSGWQSEHFLMLSYVPKLISWLFVLKKPGK